MAKELAVNWIFAAAILLSVVNASFAGIQSNSSTKVLKEQPIVINTVAQHYQNPTLGEYQLCTKSRDDCIKKCGFANDNCRSGCPICPILVEQDILIQGINDTLYRLPTTSRKLNQTNIIRLTNEIRNIINTNLGNIATTNQNNINIYQNKTSRTGGKFGVGYNEKGSCCHLLEPQKCRRSASGSHCSRRHFRTCGGHCISRVMLAKRVVTCSETNPDDCSHAVEYLPQPRRPGCQYTSRWPFINCRSGTQHISSRRSTCAHCYNIPYGNVMRGQISMGCQSCFGRSSGNFRSYQPLPAYYGQYPMYPSYATYQSYYPPAQPSYYVNEGSIEDVDEDVDEFDFQASNDGWKVEERKCINPDGTIAEKCPDDVEDEVALNSLPKEEKYEISDEIDDGLDYDYGGDVEVSRRRRRRRNNY